MRSGHYYNTTKYKLYSLKNSMDMIHTTSIHFFLLRTCK